MSTNQEIINQIKSATKPEIYKFLCNNTFIFARYLKQLSYTNSFPTALHASQILSGIYSYLDQIRICCNYNYADAVSSPMLEPYQEIPSFINDINEINNKVNNEWRPTVDSQQFRINEGLECINVLFEPIKMSFKALGLY